MFEIALPLLLIIILVCVLVEPLGLIIAVFFLINMAYPTVKVRVNDKVTPNIVQFDYTNLK